MYRNCPTRLHRACQLASQVKKFEWLEVANRTTKNLRELASRVNEFG